MLFVEPAYLSDPVDRSNEILESLNLFIQEQIDVTDLGQVLRLSGKSNEVLASDMLIFIKQSGQTSVYSNELPDELRELLGSGIQEHKYPPVYVDPSTLELSEDYPEDVSRFRREGENMILRNGVRVNWYRNDYWQEIDGDQSFSSDMEIGEQTAVEIGQEGVNYLNVLSTCLNEFVRNSKQERV